MAKVNSQDTRCVHSKVVSLREKARVERESPSQSHYPYIAIHVDRQVHYHI